MRKLVIFDLDGVLLDSCDIHYTALNQALAQFTDKTISRIDHDTVYNGLSTRTKLSRLGLDPAVAEMVYGCKQELTIRAFQTLESSERLQTMVRGLRTAGLKVMCASNCVRATVHLVLSKLGILSEFDAIFSNEDVVSPKPSPEIYTRAMTTAGVKPEETLIFEDSYVGLQAAVASGGGVHVVRDPTRLTLEFVLSAQPNLTNDVNVVIPMAGNGSRFAVAGYKDPKPFIKVFDSPMISWVVKNVGIDATYTFIIRSEFDATYQASDYLATISPGCNIVKVETVTEGAACTVLLAKEHIDNDRPLIIINSDQYIEFTDCKTAFKLVFDFLYDPAKQHFSGMISTFDGKGHPKWSYAKIGSDGVVTEVREKDPFSDHATTGLYMWRRGSDFVKYANQMIAKNIRVNNEFYVVPVFNEAIGAGHSFGIVGCDRMWGIGVPEDLEYFVAHFKH